MTPIDWQAIATTPWWVFVLVGCLLWTGYNARRPRSITITQLMMMPMMFIFLSVFAMCSMVYAMTYTHLFLWLATATLGSAFGFMQMRLTGIKAFRNTHIIHFPGNWLFLIIISALLIAKLYYHYEPKLTLSDIINPEHAIQTVSLYGFFAGLFIGKLGYALRCTKSGPYVETS